MFWIAILFCLAPSVFFILDQTGILPATRDPLTFSIIFGLIGAVWLAWIRKRSLQQRFLTFIFAAGLVALQIALIVTYVASTADF